MAKFENDLDLPKATRIVKGKKKEIDKLVLADKEFDFTNQLDDNCNIKSSMELFSKVNKSSEILVKKRITSLTLLKINEIEIAEINPEIIPNQNLCFPMFLIEILSFLKFIFFIKYLIQLF